MARRAQHRRKGSVRRPSRLYNSEDALTVPIVEDSDSDAASAYVTANSLFVQTNPHSMRSDAPSTSSGPRGLRSSMMTSYVYTPSPSQRRPLSRIQALTVGPSERPPVLTPDLISIADGAVSEYQTVRASIPDKVPAPLTFYTTMLSLRPPQAPGLSTLSPNDLALYFNAVVDAKNALTLRQSAVMADIGDCLEMVSPKFGLYDTDSMVLQSVFYELQLIKEECQTRQLGLNFWALEYFRSGLHGSDYGFSFVEDHPELYATVGRVLGDKEFSSHATQQFLQDPFSLREQRLSPFFSYEK